MRTRLFLFSLHLSTCCYALVCFWNLGAEEAGRLSQQRWRISKVGEKIIFSPLASHSNTKRSASKVGFAYSLHSGDLLVDGTVYSDEETQELAAPPGQNLWGPHPEKIIDLRHVSLESYFTEALADLGVVTRISTKVVWNPITSQWEPESFEEIVSELNHERVYDISDEDFLESVKSAASATRLYLGFSLLPQEIQALFRHPWLMRGFGLSGVVPILGRLNQSQWLQSHDIVEACHGDFVNEASADGHSYDAFMLFPLQQLGHYGLEAIEGALLSFLASPHLSTTATPSQFPLEWLKREESIPFDLRLLVVTFLTHNHRAENAFLKAVTLRYSAPRAYRIALLISQAYEAEERFWTQNRRPHRLDERARIFSTGLSFLDARQKWLIDISYDGSQPRWIPYHQRYHFYGAFVAAARLHRQWPLWPSSRISSLVQSLGQHYKMVTAGRDEEQLAKMKSFYSAGAETYLELISSSDRSSPLPRSEPKEIDDSTTRSRTLPLSLEAK